MNQKSEECCRICHAPKSSTSYLDQLDVQLVGMLKSLYPSFEVFNSSVELVLDGNTAVASQQICQICKSNLVLAFDFQRRVKLSEEQLWSQINEIKTADTELVPQSPSECDYSLNSLSPSIESCTFDDLAAIFDGFNETPLGQLEATVTQVSTDLEREERVETKKVTEKTRTTLKSGDRRYYYLQRKLDLQNRKYLRVVNKEGKTVFECKICRDRFASSYTVGKHVKRWHTTEENNNLSVS